MKMQQQQITGWILRIFIVVILAQTLPFKFGGHAESVALFTKLGVEPFGRILTGVFELAACALLLIPGRVVYGAMLSLGLMAGALMSHIAVLGFAGSYGTLGILALLVFIASSALLFLERENLSQLKERFS